jgi:hypothetical protein
LQGAGATVPVWLDAIKYTISEIIARAAVPLFFIISSILLYSRDFKWKDNVLKKTKTILVPYLIWNSVWLLFDWYLRPVVVLLLRPASLIRIENHGLMEFLNAYFSLYGGNAPHVYPFWFIRDLFILNIFAVFIKKLVDKFPASTLFAISILWFFLPLQDFVLISTSQQSLFFFILGYYIVKYNIKVEMIDKLRLLDFNIGYAACIVLELAYHLLGYDVGVLHQINVVFSVAYFLKISLLLNEKTQIKNVCLRLNDYNFIIYACHASLISYIGVFVRRIPQTGAVQLASYFGVPFLAIILCIIFGYLFKKFARPVYNIATGSR